METMKALVRSWLVVGVSLGAAVPAGAQTPVGALAIDERRGDQYGWAVDYEAEAAAWEAALSEDAQNSYPAPVNVQGTSSTVARCVPLGGDRDAVPVNVQGTSSTVAQISARHQEINAACDALDPLGTRGGSPCRCPAGYRP